MPDVVQRRPAPRTPWAIPVILAILILALVLAVVFGSKIKNALSSATATPQSRTVVVTATPGASSTPGTPQAGAPPTATPGGGASTPLPHSTPVPTVAGLTLGMITRPQHEVTSIQTGADKSDPNYSYYLDPRQVVQNTLPHYGFTKGFQIVAPAPSPSPTPYVGPDKRPLTKFVVNYDAHTYTVFTGQPGKQGAHGIWVILSILPGRQ